MSELEVGLDELRLQILAHVLPRRLEDVEYPLADDSASILRHEDQMSVQSEYDVSPSAESARCRHRPMGVRLSEGGAMIVGR